MKAGCRRVWQTVSCTLKAKVMLGHWKRTNTTGHTDFLQGCVPKATFYRSGNVLTDVQYSVTVKEENSAVKHRTIQCSFCSNHRKLLSVFWLQSEWFQPLSVRLGHKKVPSCGVFSTSAAFTVCMKALNLLLYQHYQLGHRNLISEMTATTGLYINKNV